MVVEWVYWLTRAGSRAWLCYTFTARWLAVTRRLPWRLMGFLDDAYRLGLLRMVGPVCQFRHSELQDHLAASLPAIKSGRDNAIGIAAG